MATASSLILPKPFHTINVSNAIPRSRFVTISAVATIAVNGSNNINTRSSPNGYHKNNEHQFGLRVAFQGARGAYSEFAAKTAVPNCISIPFRTFDDAIISVERKAADCAIIPVESTMEGNSLRNYDLLLRHDLLIVQEINLFVHYCLLAMPGVRATQLRRVISHPMALAHCGRTLARLGLNNHCEPFEDTAGAVEMLRSNCILDAAAIASPRAAQLYGLDVLAHGLQDESWNVTRFLVLAPRTWTSSSRGLGRRKTSMVVAHRGGSMVMLLKVLSAFSKRSVNLTKLEVINSSAEGKSPVMILDVRGKGGGLMRTFPRVLYVDFEGSVEDVAASEAIDEIAESFVFVRILGCYAADPSIYDLH